MFTEVRVRQSGTGALYAYVATTEGEVAAYRRIRVTERKLRRAILHTRDECLKNRKEEFVIEKVASEFDNVHVTWPHDDDGPGWTREI